MYTLAAALGVIGGSTRRAGRSEGSGTEASKNVYGRFIEIPYKRGIHSLTKDEYTGTEMASAAKLQETTLDSELEVVEQWRLEALQRAGYDSESAALLAASHEVDLHGAVDLLGRGCPLDLALQILL
jgi:hypothetical protein